MLTGQLTHPDIAMLVDPLCFRKEGEDGKNGKTLLPRSEERVVGRSNDRVSKLRE
jgi:hypothetical protein